MEQLTLLVCPGKAFMLPHDTIYKKKIVFVVASNYSAGR